MRRTRLRPAALRRAGILALSAAAPVLFVGCGGGSEASRPATHSNLCSALEGDLALAVFSPARPPEGEALLPIRAGKCDFSTRRTFADPLPGASAGSEVILAARIDLVPGFSPEGLVRVRAAAEAGANNRVTDLPNLGTDAFLVVRKDRLGGANDEALATDPMPTGRPIDNDSTTSLPLPITAHWRLGDMLWTVSANRSGADLTETKRLILRLAALLNRRPIDGGKFGSAG